VIDEQKPRPVRRSAGPAALKQARRFGFLYRHSIYRAAATSHRALQLTHVFPALALAIYASRRVSIKSPELSVDHAEEAISLVERGAPLRQVSELMGLAAGPAKSEAWCRALGSRGRSEFCL
jgi:hypothetical protein